LPSRVWEKLAAYSSHKQISAQVEAIRPHVPLLQESKPLCDIFANSFDFLQKTGPMDAWIVHRHILSALMYRVDRLVVGETLSPIKNFL
jgi:hypothetical protein